MEKITVINPWTAEAVDIDEVDDDKLDAMAIIMDDEIRESIHRKHAPCSATEFFARYVDAVGPEEAGKLWFS